MTLFAKLVHGLTIFFCKHLYYITGFCDKKFNFCKLQIRAQELSNDVSFVIFGHKTWDFLRILVFKYPSRDRVKLYPLPCLGFLRDQAETFRVPSPFPWLACFNFWPLWIPLWVGHPSLWVPSVKRWSKMDFIAMLPSIYPAEHFKVPSPMSDLGRPDVW